MSWLPRVSKHMIVHVKYVYVVKCMIVHVRLVEVHDSACQTCDKQMLHVHAVHVKLWYGTV